MLTHNGEVVDSSGAASGLVLIRYGYAGFACTQTFYLLWVSTMPSLPFIGHKEVTNGAMTRVDRTITGTVVRLLNEALASEIICILRYKRHYFMTARISSHHVKAKLLQHVTEERAHADQLAERIVQLGGQPMLSLEQLLNRSHAEYVEGDSVEKMLTADLIAERAAVESYRAMIASIGPDDPTTRRVLEQIVVQEEEHAEKLVSLLMG
jgi:bacterioferritin